MYETTTILRFVEWLQARTEPVQDPANERDCFYFGIAKMRDGSHGMRFWERLNGYEILDAYRKENLTPEPQPSLQDRVERLKAENEILRAALETIRTDTDPEPTEPAEGYGEDDMNYRGDDREGCLDSCFAVASKALADVKEETAS